jgi:large subunit ribosomal protein L15
MKLNELKYTQGSRNHKEKIVGRGHGSGMGKTSTRGYNGQKQRKSGHTRPGFEGGQTPLYRRLPKIGFNNARFQTEVDVINLSYLVNINETNLTREKMSELKLISRPNVRVKIIGNIKLDRAFTIEADLASKGAQASILASGGKVIFRE